MPPSLLLPEAMLLGAAGRADELHLRCVAAKQGGGVREGLAAKQCLHLLRCLAAKQGGRDGVVEPCVHFLGCAAAKQGRRRGCWREPGGLRLWPGPPLPFLG